MKTQEHLTDTDYSAQILANRWQTVLADTPSFMYFSTGSKADFHPIIEAFASSLREPFILSSECLSAPSLRTPYFPFLNIIKNYIEETGDSPAAMLDAARVYPPHRDIFMAFLTNTEAHRKDILIVNEVQYEQTQIQRTILALLQYISRKKPVIIAVEGLRNAGPALFQFLLFAQNNADSGRLLFLFAYTRTFNWTDAEKESKWDAFLLLIAEKNTVFDIGSNRLTNLEEDCSTPAPVTVSAEELVLRSRMNYLFLSFEESISCGTEAYPSALGLTGADADRLQYSVLNSLGDSHYYLGENNQAMVQYQTISDKAQRGDNGKELARSYRKTGFAFLAMGDIGSAKQYSLLDLKITEELKGKVSPVYAYFFSFFLNIRSSSFITREMYFNLMEMLKAPKLENMYAYFCGNSEIYSHYFDTLMDFIHIADESIAYYQKNRNDYGLSFAYHKKAIVLSNNEQFDESFALMKKSLKIKEEIGEPIYIVRALNGIGYLHYLTENYAKSFSFYRKSMRLLGKINNHEETNATLYNIAMLYYVTGNYEKCAVILDSVLQTMYILKIKYFPYRRSISDLHILKALCYVKTGDMVKGLELIHKIRPEEDSLYWKQRFLFNMLQGMVYSRQEDFDSATGFFRKASEIAETGTESNKDILPIYYYEYASALLANNKKTEARTVIEEGLSHYEATGSQFHKQRLINLRVTYIPNKIRCELGDIEVNFDTLLKLAKQEFVLGRLQKKMRDIRFLNIIQTELMQTANRADIASKTLKLLSHHFPLDILIFQLVENNIPGTVLAQSVPDSVDRDDLAAVIEKTALMPGKKIFNGRELALAYPDLPIALTTLVTIPVLESKIPVAGIFLASRKNETILTHEDYEILLATAGQIGLQFEKITHDEEILNQSYKDELTGLNNRQAMQAKIREETIRIERAKNKSNFNFSVAFIDLDNFKYYNDTFNHTIGDMILRKYSRLLTQSFREIDFIVRYGGDEFVILMPDTNSSDAVIPLRRIYAALENCGYFLPLLERKTGIKTSIAPENRLSCSIGLASFEHMMEREEIIEKLLQYADHALYDAKNSGKNQLHVWTK